MNPANPVISPSVEELPQDLIDLKAAVVELPVEHRLRLEVLLGRVVDSTKRRRKIMNLVQDALSQLRLDMKYLLFDLEATRRERDDYKRQVEENNF
ncbi:MAG: transcriptional regulator [Planctomycetaceae bacterium]|nr:transcriptional regulator [Planctomycetaceae bacterium]